MSSFHFYSVYFSIRTSSDNLASLYADGNYISQIDFFELASVIEWPYVDAISSSNNEQIITNIEIVTPMIVLKSVK